MIVRESTKYLMLKPPPFSRLVDYARDGSYHGTARPLGRRGVSKSPVGQMFHQFFGEKHAACRHVCNAVEELGQSLTTHRPGGCQRAPHESLARITCSS